MKLVIQLYKMRGTLYIVEYAEQKILLLNGKNIFMFNKVIHQFPN